jgi:hypothetical protein
MAGWVWLVSDSGGAAAGFGSQESWKTGAEMRAGVRSFDRPQAICRLSYDLRVEASERAGSSCAQRDFLQPANSRL